jgi:hypothetical protein
MILLDRASTIISITRTEQPLINSPSRDWEKGEYESDDPVLRERSAWYSNEMSDGCEVGA